MFNFVLSIFESLGAFGVFLLMLIENIFPPIPSEIILSLAGYYAAKNQTSLIPVILAGTLGSVVGALFWYYIGLWIGVERIEKFAERHGRWLTLSPAEVSDVDRWFHAHGRWAVLLGRMVPAVRTLISIPAGVVRMPLWKFLVYTALGSGAWTILLAVAGYQLGARYAIISSFVEPVSNLIIGGAVAWYIWRVLRFGHTKK